MLLVICCVWLCRWLWKHWLWRYTCTSLVTRKNGNTKKETKVKLGFLKNFSFIQSADAEVICLFLAPPTPPLLSNLQLQKDSWVPGKTSFPTFSLSSLSRFRPPPPWCLPWATVKLIGGPRLPLLPLALYRSVQPSQSPTTTKLEFTQGVRNKSKSLLGDTLCGNDTVVRIPPHSSWEEEVRTLPPYYGGEGMSLLGWGVKGRSIRNRRSSQRVWWLPWLCIVEFRSPPNTSHLDTGPQPHRVTCLNTCLSPGWWHCIGKLRNPLGGEVWLGGMDFGGSGSLRGRIWPYFLICFLFPSTSPNTSTAPEPFYHACLTRKDWKFWNHEPRHSFLLFCWTFSYSDENS